jgi:hypothetical protein
MDSPGKRIGRSTDGGGVRGAEEAGLDKLNQFKASTLFPRSSCRDSIWRWRASMTGSVDFPSEISMMAWSTQSSSLIRILGRSLPKARKILWVVNK